MHSILTEEVNQAETKFNYSLSNFESEIKSMTCIYQVLRSFIRYSSRTQDGELIALCAVKKMQELTE